MGEDTMTEPTTSGFTTYIGLLAKANELRHQEDYEAAIALYIKSIEYFGESADLLAVVASCYFALAGGTPDETGRNFEAAILWMEKAIELAPNDARLHADLAQYYALGFPDYERAIQEYRKAIELDPHSKEALAGAAALYGVPEEVVTLDEAIGWLERVVQLDPNDPNHHFRLGKLYWEAGRSADAEKEWLKALLCPQPLASGSARMIESVLLVRKNT